MSGAPKGRTNDHSHPATGERRTCARRRVRPSGTDFPNLSSHGFPAVTRGYRRAILWIVFGEPEPFVEGSFHFGFLRK